MWWRRTRSSSSRPPPRRAVVPSALFEVLEVAIDLDLGPDAPDDPVQRRRDLLRSVVEQIGTQGGVATVTDLAQVLDVSEATVRRDLQVLRDGGTAVETRGRRSG